MHFKQQIAEWVINKKYQDLLQAAAAENKKTIRCLVRLTYSRDELLHWRAVEALGIVCGATADRDPEIVRDIIRRFVWSMNDESGTNSWGASEAIAEIVYNRPNLYADFASVMINASIDEEMFQKGMLWGIGRLAGKISYLNEILHDVETFLEHPAAELRGHAAWALGQMGRCQNIDKLEILEADKNMLNIYLYGEMCAKTVGELAGEAIAKIG